MSNEKEKGVDQAEAGGAPVPPAEKAAEPKPAAAKPEKTATEKALEKKLKAAESEQAEMAERLAHMEALLGQMAAKTEELEAKMAAPAPLPESLPEPADVLASLETEKVKAVMVYARGGLYVVRNPETDRNYQFQRLFPGGPALAMTEKGQTVNVNHFENGETGVTFYRGFLRVTQPGDIDFFRAQAARDFNLRIAKVEVA